MSSLEILDMPNWKSKVLDAVAWLLGYREEHVYLFLLNTNIEDFATRLDNE